MKEKIYTIPVNDAFRRNDRDCPLCVLREGLETQLLDYYLGPSLMEPDVRVSTNERGFCRTHANALHARENNRLGLGLMLHTRLTRVTGSVGDALRKAGGDARRGWTGRRILKVQGGDRRVRGQGRRLPGQRFGIQNRLRFSGHSLFRNTPGQRLKLRFHLHAAEQADRR